MHLAHRTTGGFGRMAGVMALGFVAGLAANGARKAAIQGVSVAAGDWVDALKAEHRMVEGLFAALLKTEDHEHIKRNGLLAKIAYALTKHAIQEENVIYPALSEAAQPEEARGLTEDHARMKTFIYELRNMPAADPRWLQTVREFEREITEHIRQEENYIFPALHAAMSADDNARLTKMMNWEGFKVA